MAQQNSSRAAVSGPLLASVILPTCNRSDVLPLCLQHLEQQTLAAFEVIVVNDGSTDSTAELLAHLAQQSPLRLHIAHQPNSGPATARNRAISMAAAPLCIIIGDDILAAPDFIEQHVRFHQNNPQQNVAALGLTRWNETAQTVTPFMRWLDNGFQFDYIRLLQGHPPDSRHFYTSNLSLKTPLLRRHPFDERFRKALLEDAELGYRLVRTEDLRIQFLPQAVAEHLHPMTFRKSCARAREIGRHEALFQHCCPAIDPVPRGSARTLARDLLCRHTWLAPPITWLADVLTRVWCPNPFIEPVLAYHAALGRRDPR